MYAQDGVRSLIIDSDNATALEHFLKCLRIDPKNEGTLFNLAFTYHIDHQLDLAKEYYSKVLLN